MWRTKNFKINKWVIVYPYAHFNRSHLKICPCHLFRFVGLCHMCEIFGWHISVHNTNYLDTYNVHVNTVIISFYWVSLFIKHQWRVTSYMNNVGQEWVLKLTRNTGFFCTYVFLFGLELNMYSEDIMKGVREYNQGLPTCAFLLMRKDDI